MRDNLDALTVLFDRKEDPRYADGYAYLCQNGGQECNVGDASFDCLNGSILPIYVKCRYGCGRSWQLEISPTDTVSIQ